LAEGTYDVISDAKLRDIRPHANDDPGHLVAEHRRRRGELVRGEQEVGVAQPGCTNLDEDLAAYGSGDVHVFELESTADGIENECFHARSLCPARADSPSSVVKDAPVPLHSAEHLLG
jgi:hypothetical protein